MKRDKIVVIPMGSDYRISYSLDVNDVIDAKIYDMSRSGMFPQMLPCELKENGGARTFEYITENMKPLPELLRTEVNKKDMLTIIYNVLDGLESFGKSMVSLSYVAKDVQHIFVSPETKMVQFVVAPVDKEFTDMNEVRNLVKTIIVDARYSEQDGDNYVARLINYVNMPGTFSSSDMKGKVIDLLEEMGASIPNTREAAPVEDMQIPGGNSHILRTDNPSPKVSRLGVMRNNARMNGMQPPMGPNGMNGMPPVPPMGPNGMNGMPPVPPMGPDGMNGMPPVQPMDELPPRELEGMNELPPEVPGPQPGSQPELQIEDTMTASGDVSQETHQEQPQEHKPESDLQDQIQEHEPEKELQETSDNIAEEAKPVTKEEDISTVQPMDGPFGGAPVPPMGNPFGGAPVPPMGEPFGNAPVPPMNDQKPDRQFTGVPSMDEPAPHFIRTRTGERIDLDKAEFKIGHKASDVDYVISDNPAISRVHCVITKNNGVCFVRDNHSTNGTYINGDRLNEGEERFLTNNAVVILGNEEFIYHIR